MTKHLILAGLALALGSGCVFSRKSTKPQDATITAEVEETFRRRWLEQRTRELVSQGIAAEAARSQAEAEFLERYDFSNAAQRK